MKSACVFDLDGVIVDTAKYHYLAWKRLAGGLGFEFSELQNEQLKGVSRTDSLNTLLKEGGITMLSETEKKALGEKKNAWYLEYVAQMTPLEILPGVLEFLQELKQHQIKIALGSASKNAKKILDKLHISSLFDTVVDGTQVLNAKPDPEVFLLGAETLQVAPPHCVVFEDAEAGIEAAFRAGMASVGVGQATYLKKADFVIEGFAPSVALNQVKAFLYE